MPSPKPLATVAVLNVALAIGALGCAWLAVRAQSVAAAERAAKEREIARREEAEERVRAAQDQIVETQMVLAYFQAEVLGARSPTGGPQPDITVLKALEQAEPVIATMFSDRPLLEAAVRNAVSMSYQQLGSFDEAIPLLQKAVELRREMLGANHSATLSLMNNLGIANLRAGRHQKALSILEETLRTQVAVFGENHQDTIVAANNLALAYCETQNPEKAITVLEPALQQDWVKENPGHPDTLTCRHTLARACQDLQQFNRAISILEGMLQVQVASAGPLDSTSLRIMGSLANALHAANRLEDSEVVCRKLVALHESRNGPEHAVSSLARIGLAMNLLSQHRNVEAEHVLQGCLQTLTRTQPDSWVCFAAQSLLGKSLLGQSRDMQSTDPVAAEALLARAEPLLINGYTGLKAKTGEIPLGSQARRIESLRQLIDLYSARGMPDEAAKWQSEIETLDVR